MTKQGSKKYEKTAIRKIKWFMVLYTIFILVVPTSLAAIFPAHALAFKILFVILAFAMLFIIKKMVTTMTKELNRITESEQKDNEKE